MNIDLIKKIRFEHGLSQREMGDIMGITGQMYNYIEAGSRQASIKALIRLQSEYNIPDDVMWKIASGTNNKK